jgi:hypothetical protein
MSIPYEFVRAMEGKKPSWGDRGGRSPKDQMEFLMQDGNMKDKYLGFCLDSCRWGGRTTVMWETDVRGLMNFIQEWRGQNNDNHDLYHERSINELFTRFELTHRKHDKCPRNEDHKEIMRDVAGRIRCGHIYSKSVRPSFARKDREEVDELSQTVGFRVYEQEPDDPRYEDDDGDWIVPEPEYSRYIREKEKWAKEKPVEIFDVCYAIIDDRSVVLPFQTILERENLAPKVKETRCGDYEINRKPCKRLDELKDVERKRAEELDECPGHIDINYEVVFPFDGWTLAFFLQRWKEQVVYDPSRELRWFAPKSEEWFRTNNSRNY